MEKSNKKTQCDLIIAYIAEHGSISQLEATKAFGCTRLPGRIYDLIHAGHKIKKEMVKGKNCCNRTVYYARYSFREQGAS